LSNRHCDRNKKIYTGIGPVLSRPIIPELIVKMSKSAMNLKSVFNKEKTFRPKKHFEPGTSKFNLHKKAQASLRSGKCFCD